MRDLGDRWAQVEARVGRLGRVREMLILQHISSRSQFPPRSAYEPMAMGSRLCCSQMTWCCEVAPISDPEPRYWLQACRDRWRALKISEKRVTGRWSAEEDGRLKALVEEYQEGRQQEPVRGLHPDGDPIVNPASNRHSRAVMDGRHCNNMDDGGEGLPCLRRVIGCGHDLTLLILAPSLLFPQFAKALNPGSAFAALRCCHE